ncbi:hypothetical protein SAMN04488498_115122 [Mesorhizobium albiziae]|uniref:Uncharacterized protein n=2 Tax=Neomesorhizobium albiziae TaxID=335020 RepID=A0A1I4D3L9_9HYPH|nr:hypothetical protein [Mesorhizobium albiziae]GLS28311.1 hypothetical protein GCM10007937_00180 [Mesorhizobium albiziae]SFK87583.1 hypothetical protein SAMN04488498_115122 [Mesorhizobium albiziae]
MTSKPLCNDHDAHVHPAPDGTYSKPPGEYDAVSLLDEAQRCARELMASVPFEKDGKALPVGAGAGAEVLAVLMRRRFGTKAPTVAAWCAMLAWSEGTDASYQTWTEAFKSVRTAPQP